MREPSTLGRVGHCQCNAHEAVCRQARSADQRPAHLGRGQPFTGVFRLYRAALEAANLGTFLQTEPLAHQPAYPSEHRADLFRSGVVTAADSPARLSGTGPYRTPRVAGKTV